MDATEAAVKIVTELSWAAKSENNDGYTDLMTSAIGYLKRLFDPQPPTPESCGAGHPGGYKCDGRKGHEGPHFQSLHTPSGWHDVQWGPSGYELFNG